MPYSSTETHYLDTVRRLSEERIPVRPAYKERLQVLKGVKAVIFDVYGTLFSSAAGDIGTQETATHPTLLKEACRQVGISLSSPQATSLIQSYKNTICIHHQRMIEKGLEYPEIDIRTVWKDALGAEKLPQDVNISRLAIEYEMRINPVWPMPEARACLEKLSAEGIPMGIISNAQFYTPLLFPALLGVEIEDIPLHTPIWSYQWGVAKPNPMLFDLAKKAFQQRYGYLASELMYVGNDMLNDIWGASQAGMRTVLFAGDNASLRLRAQDARLTGISADAVVSSLGRIMSLMEHST